jgi:pyruvate/2-oxoglutarate dehydrogenase complex dihydrolipoamide dehydrogenase (E3) component
MTKTYDAIIIGTGQSGPPLAARLSQAGMRIAVVERRLFGGTCVNTGCIPTKTMVASAYAAHLARRANDYGVSITGEISVDMRKVKARKDDVSGKSRTGVESWMKGLDRCDVYQGHARFRSARELAIGDQVIGASRIFLNVGGRASVPDAPGLDGLPYLTNSSMMDVDFLPGHLVIVGGSYIGLEFGQMFRRFGSRVTIIESGPRVIKREDPDISAAIHDVFAGEGIDIRYNARDLRFGGRAGAIEVHLTSPSGAATVSGSHVLFATGRRPNTDDLGLDAAGIKTDARGYVVVDDELKTNVDGVWAMGDCNGKGAFTHTSYNDYEIIAANLLDNGRRRVSDRITAYGLFIDPPLGRAGLTEAEVIARGRPALVGMRPMTRVGRAVEKGETHGLMKILVDRDSREILGAAVMGPGGDEAIHCVLDTMYAKAPYDVLQRAMHIHPTVAELIPTILGELRPLAAPAV